MSEANQEDQCQPVVQRAVDQLASVDPYLAGTRPTKWLLVVEHEKIDSDGKTVTVVRSHGLRSWDELGLLKFAETVERARVADRVMFGEGSDDEGNESDDRDARSGDK